MYCPTHGCCCYYYYYYYYYYYHDSLKLLNVNTLKLPGALIVTQELLKTPCSSPIYKYLSKSIIHLNLLNYVKI